MTTLDVEALPRRVAHATYALLHLPEIEREYPYGPYKASEVLLCDGESYSAQMTGAALREAQKKGLCMYVPGGEGYWTPTNLAREHKRAFEDRYLRETDE